MDSSIYSHCHELSHFTTCDTEKGGGHAERGVFKCSFCHVCCLTVMTVQLGLSQDTLSANKLMIRLLIKCSMHIICYDSHLKERERARKEDTLCM